MVSNDKMYDSQKSKPTIKALLNGRNYTKYPGNPNLISFNFSLSFSSFAFGIRYSPLCPLYFVKTVVIVLYCINW